MKNRYRNFVEKTRRDIEEFLDVPEAPPVNWKVAGPRMLELVIILLVLMMTIHLLVMYVSGL